MQLTYDVQTVVQCMLSPAGKWISAEYASFAMFPCRLEPLYFVLTLLCYHKGLRLVRWKVSEVNTRISNVYLFFLLNE